MAAKELNLDLIAPGARIEIRDEEWLVRRVDTVGEGKAIHAVGVSELTRGKEGLFLTQLEKNIRLLAPEETRFVADTSSAYRQAKLYLESQLRRTTPALEERPKLYVGHRAAMDVVDYQLAPALQALEQPRQRILIADAVGLGKTLECGILLSELIRRGRGKRILVLAIKSLLTQFQKEMWSRFSIPLVRLDSQGIQKIRRHIPTNHNPFEYYDRAIISIDTLKQDGEYRRYLEEAYWDIIVIDEAHNVAERGSKVALRAKLAQRLSRRSDTLIMLSATPHDGKAESFASLMNMLNPTAIANPKDYSPEDIKGLFVRRFKKDIQDQVGDAFQQRQVHEKHRAASGAEDAAYEALAKLNLQQGEQRSGKILFRTTLEKALFSSPAACLQTIDNRLRNLEKKEAEDLTQDLEALEGLRERVAAIGPNEFSRYQQLLLLIQKEMGWKKAANDRLVIFTERIETLKFLQRQLLEDTKLKEKEIEILHGGLSDIEQQRVVEAFGKESEPVRVLICSDVAAEGINLHYLSHRMVHFDIPWSLMVFQQRNGRIDRYGQTHTPEIYYLMTDSQVEKIRGDQRILSLLVQKDQQATENIGDPSALMGHYDAQAEETVTAMGIQEGLSAAQFATDFLMGDGSDSFEALLAEFGKPAVESVRDRTATSLSLYPTTLDYVVEGLQQIGIREMKVHPDRLGLDITEIPADLDDRLQELPVELWPDKKNKTLRFTCRAREIQQEIAACRKEENAWPQLHYLWEQHPVIDWLNDKVTASFGRHQAPVLSLSSLPAHSLYFILSGLFPNVKGHPLIWRWMAVEYQQGQYKGVISFEDFLTRSRLNTDTLPNPNAGFDEALMRRLLTDAVPRAKLWMKMRKEDFEEAFEQKLQDELKALKGLEQKQMQQLEIRFEDASGHTLEAKGKEQRQIERLFQDYETWIKDTMTVADQPYLQVVAAVQGLAP